MTATATVWRPASLPRSPTRSHPRVAPRRHRSAGCPTTAAPRRTSTATEEPAGDRPRPAPVRGFAAPMGVAYRLLCRQRRRCRLLPRRLFLQLVVPAQDLGERLQREPG